MKIIELQSENIKRIKAVRIKPDGSLVQITGRNGAGKSSVLDSIMMALAGGASIPEKPIREGEEKAKVFVDLGEFKVTRTWTSNEKTYLAVETKDGAKYPSPQALLDKLTGKLSFDPLEFARMESKCQAETLRQLVGIDFASLDYERKEIYDERQGINRDIRDLGSRLRNMPEIEAPDEEVNIAELTQSYTEALNHRDRNNEKKHRLGELERSTKNCEDRVKEAKRQHEEAEVMLQRHRSNLTAIQQEVEALIEPDVHGVSEKLRTAEATNKAVRQKKERYNIQIKLEATLDAAKQLTGEIQKIDEEKQRVLSSAKFPVPGLSFNEGGVIYNGIPFSQASSAEQLRISVAVGLTFNPKIRIILIRDGSLLDADNLKIIGEMAEASDSQIWIERVATNEKVGIVIEDGEIRE